MSSLGGSFVVYLGTHGDAGAHRADVILPGAAYTEKSGTYVNTEGRVQQIRRAAFPPGEAREDWAVLRALSEAIGHRLPFDSLAELRRQLYREHPDFARLDMVPKGELNSLQPLLAMPAEVQTAPFRNPVTDFYMTNPIARASRIMADCSAVANNPLRVAAE
jgi:NADH-quinone oxidoreductase subunit G